MKRNDYDEYSTYVIDDGGIVSRHDLDVRVSNAKRLFDTNEMILETRDVQIINLRDKHAIQASIR